MARAERAFETAMERERASTASEEETLENKSTRAVQN